MPRSLKIKLSFRGKITLIACSISAVFFLCYFLFLNVTNYHNSIESLHQRAEMMTEMRAESLSLALWNYDLPSAQTIIKSFHKDTDFFGIEIFDEDGKVFAESFLGKPDKSKLVVAQDIFYSFKGQNRKIGKLVLYSSTDRILSDLYRQIIYSVLMFFVLITAISAAVFATFRYATKPLTDIANAMEEYGKGQVDVILPPMESNDEIGILAKNFSKMKSELNNITGNLETLVEKRTNQLENALIKVQAANDSKSKFLANFSHELRTPLNAILGFSEFIHQELLGSVGNPSYKEYAKNIHDSGAHLLDIINDILDLSKAEAGKLVISMEHMDLGKNLEECVKYIERKASDNAIRIVLEIPDSMPMIIIDRIRLKQIMLNLFSNAVKYTPKGGNITVSVFVELLPHSRTQFTIKVKDTGCGMTPQQAAAAFENFMQVDEDKERAAKGTGLGLPLTKHLVELMGGTIRLESQKGHGTTAVLQFVTDNTLPIGEKYIQEFTLQ